MKYFFVFFYLIVINTISAQKKYSDSIKIVINQNILNNTPSLEVYIPIIKTNVQPKKIVDIKSNNWDNLNFNPYSFQSVNFPLQLKFTDTTYASPINKPKVITSRYGWRHGRPHKGIDIDLETGDSINAVLDGVVRFAKNSRGHGKTIIIRHFNGLETTYAHLSEYIVKANDTVSKGQIIGKGGNSGRSSGSHLHFITTYKGQTIHPEYLFDFSEKNKIRNNELWVTKEWTNTSYHSAYKKSKLKLYKTKEEALKSQIKTKKIYTIKPGDTLSRIANQNHISINSICKINRIRKSSKLRIGQKLILEI